MEKCELKIVKIADEELSAGICDNCNNVTEVRELGDTFLICLKKKRIIEPELLKDRVSNCEFYHERIDRKIKST